MGNGQLTIQLTIKVNSDICQFAFPVFAYVNKTEKPRQKIRRGFHYEKIY